MTSQHRDHGGGIDAACREYGGIRLSWADLSTGINPVPYPATMPSADAWTTLPDTAATEALCAAARTFWQIPKEAAILAAPGASALIAQIPTLCPHGKVHIPAPTYNEHAAAFDFHGWSPSEPQKAAAQVVVHPNNPTGMFWSEETLPVKGAQLTVIDESFCDVAPEKSLVSLAAQNGVVVLKSFGKFWGLAGLRLGFAIGDPVCIAKLRSLLGPWAVSGPALSIGATALADIEWAKSTRRRLVGDSLRLDQLMQAAGADIEGGTPLFRLYRVDDAKRWQHRLARAHIWSRVFPYNPQWLRLGVPHPLHWARIEAALG